MHTPLFRMLFSIDIYKYIKRDTVVNSYFYFTDDRITVVKIIFFFQLTKESPHYTNHQHKILEVHGVDQAHIAW